MRVGLSCDEVCVVGVPGACFVIPPTAALYRLPVLLGVDSAGGCVAGLLLAILALPLAAGDGEVYLPCRHIGSHHHTQIMTHHLLIESHIIATR